jgi:hypothetical protein
VRVADLVRVFMFMFMLVCLLVDYIQDVKAVLFFVVKT